MELAEGRVLILEGVSISPAHADKISQVPVKYQELFPSSPWLQVLVFLGGAPGLPRPSCVWGMAGEGVGVHHGHCHNDKSHCGGIPSSAKG